MKSCCVSTGDKSFQSGKFNCPKNEDPYNWYYDHDEKPQTDVDVVGEDDETTVGSNSTTTAAVDN